MPIKEYKPEELAPAPDAAGVNTAPTEKPPSLYERYGAPLVAGAGNLLQGAAKGVGGDVTALLLQGVRPFIGPEQYQLRKQAVAGLLAPENTTQAVGKGLEQAGEFLAPGLGEEKALSLLPKVAEDAPLAMRLLQPAARVGYQGLTSGLVNKAQGGEFGTGAGVGLLGGVGGEAMKAAAPYVASSALGIRMGDLGGGRTRAGIGLAALDETSGLTPAAVRRSAAEREGSLYGERQGLLRGSTTPASFAPQRNISTAALGRVGPLSKGGISAPSLEDELKQQDAFLYREGGKPEGVPIPEQVTPEFMGRWQQGYGRENTEWNPLRVRSDPALDTARSIYGATTGELERTAPGTAPLNRRISNLIAVKSGAARQELGASPIEQIVRRVVAPTGGLLLPVVGGEEGYRHGGWGGAAAGAAAGFAPAFLSPTARMAAARLAYGAGPRLLPAVTGGGLGLFDRGQVTAPNRSGLFNRGQITAAP